MTLTLIVSAFAAVSVFFLYLWMTAGKSRSGWIAEYCYAHRGLHDDKHPENTLPAFMEAVKYGYGIELDVRLSKDGEVVVIHDADVERVTGVKKNVCDCTAGELGKMKVCGADCTIPTLMDVVELVGGRVPLLIEIKSEGAAGELEKRVGALLGAYSGPYAVQSFSPLSVAWFRNNMPSVLRGQLSGLFHEGAEHIPKFQRFAVKNLLTNFLCRPDFINYEAAGIERHCIKRLRKRGVTVLAWVVESADEERDMHVYADSVVFENYHPVKI